VRKQNPDWSAVHELLRRQLLRSESGQDLIEYALVVGFLAVTIAATIPYAVTEPINAIYTEVLRLLNASPAAG
jgi:Flp pilus assembly pilin Flp